MSKFKMGVVAVGFTLTAFASPAFAIGSDSECTAEGGSMVNVKGSDFCLVPIRPEEYKDPVYDGNQLGVVECPGDKLNDGMYCMYPVTLRPDTSKADVTPMPATVTPVEMNTEKTMGDTVIQKSKSEIRAEEKAAKKAAKAAEKAAKAAEKAAEKALEAAE